MIRWSLSFAMLMAIASCAESGTFVVLDIEYGDLGDVDELQITGVTAEGMQLGMNVTGRVSRARIQLPDDTAGEVTLTVAASFDGVRRGYGQDRILVRSLEENSAQVLLRAPCGAWCSPGELACALDGANAVVRCTLPQDGSCFEYERASECASGETCSLGECSTTCVNECSAGESMCAGPTGSRPCGDFDADPCLDLGPIETCADEDTCSGGECRGECVSECPFGAQRCENGRTSMCEDRNGDGCFEWGPGATCPAPGPECNGSELVVSEPSCLANECSVREVRTPCTCVDGECAGGCNVESCDEPGPCRTTTGATCGEAGCIYPIAAGAECDDGLSCTEGDACNLTGECVGTTDCPPPAPVCNLAGDALITSTAGMCLDDGCSWATTTESCECEDGACVVDCTPRWGQISLLDMGDLNARLAIAPDGQVHLAQLRGGDVYHSSPPAFPGTLAAAGVVDFRFHMTSDGTPHIFAQDDENAVRHHYFDGTWITDSTPLSDAISFAIAVTPGDFFDYYYRGAGFSGIRYRQCTTLPDCTWTGGDGLLVAGGGGPIDPIDAVATSDTASQVLMTEGGMTYIAERNTDPAWTQAQIAMASAESGALTIGAMGPEYVFRIVGTVTYAIPPGLPTMLANNAINNVDMASNGEHTFVAWRAATSEGVNITNANTGVIVHTVNSGRGSAWLPQIEFDDSGGAHVLYGVGENVLVYATSPCL